MIKPFNIDAFEPVFFDTEFTRLGFKDMP